MGGFPESSKAATSKVGPIALLALFVVVGVALLHALDKTPSVSERTLEATEAATSAANAPVAPVTPTTLALRTPSEVKVLVTNGTQVSGVAAKFNDALRPRGYQLGTPGNTTAPTTESSIQYASGYEAEAKALASSLNLPEDMVKAMGSPAPVADTQMSNVIVVIGDQLSKNPPASTSSAQTNSSVIGPLQSSNNSTSGTTVAPGAASAGSATGATSGSSYSSGASTASTVTTTPLR